MHPKKTTCKYFTLCSLLRLSVVCGVYWCTRQTYYRYLSITSDYPHTVWLGMPVMSLGWVWLLHFACSYSLHTSILYFDLYQRKSSPTLSWMFSIEYVHDIIVCPVLSFKVQAKLSSNIPVRQGQISNQCASLDLVIKFSFMTDWVLVEEKPREEIFSSV